MVAIIGLLAALTLPNLSRAKAKGQGTYCGNNLRQLVVALTLYAGDFNDALPYNMGSDGTRRTVAAGAYLNWANNVMTWELDPGNTNVWLMANTGLGSYVGGAASVFHCPADTVVSVVQRQAGWSGRVRSVSMNAMLGNAGEFMTEGVNTNNPTYRQFTRLADVPAPDQIFAFVEEHPDSINDGYFLNRFYHYEWLDLPASYHNGGANFAFVDGHVETRGWRLGSTKPASAPDAAQLPIPLNSSERSDLYWVLSRTSVLSPDGGAAYNATSR